MIKQVVLCVVFAHLAISSFTSSEDNPLQLAYEQFEELVQNGCDVNVLPDSIDWCDDTLNRYGKLPDNTVCQSIYTEELYLVCRYTKWRSMKKPGREERSISQAYNQQLNKTCMFFCVYDEADGSSPHIKVPPSFTTCPASATIYPEDNSTDVTYGWDLPTADDADGSVVSIEQIVGDPVNSTFNASGAPGTDHVISYVATDDDNLNWTCSFTLTAEIPVCPPILHLANGYLDCTDSNFRLSTCAFVCNQGYQLNGSLSTDCQDDGTWTFGDDLPQCLPSSCDVTSLNNVTDPNLDIVCGNVTGEFGDVCWLECKNEFILRNDELESDVLTLLTQTMNEAAEAFNLAQESAQGALELVEDKKAAISDLEDQVASAQNATDVLEQQLLEETTTLNSLNGQMASLLIDLADAEQQLADATTRNESDLSQYEDTVVKVNRAIQNLNVTLQDQRTVIEDLENRIENARLTTAQLNADLASAYAELSTLELNATGLLSTGGSAFQAYVNASARYNESFLYSQTAYKVVPTFVQCSENGQWTVSGDPYCIDLDPPVIKCLPTVTHYLDPGKTSGVVPWSIPEVEDNTMNSTLVETGPRPGDVLSLGSHVATYQAFDDDMKPSLVCTVTINVLVRICEDLGRLITDPRLQYSCEHFEIGANCTLSCDSKLYPISGPSFVTCKLDSQSQTPQWDWQNTTCQAMCADPIAPDHGVVECEYGTLDADNSTDNATFTNATSGVTCTVSCNPGYMLPYGTGNEFSCDEEGTWAPSDFPNQCIPTGEEKTAEFSFELTHVVTDCSVKADVINSVKTSLSTSISTFGACTGGNNCVVSDPEGTCQVTTNTAIELTFDVTVSCDDNTPTALEIEATCNLLQGNSLKSSVVALGVNQDGVDFSMTSLSNGPTTDVDICAIQGAVLIGPYCAKCEPGHFQSGTTCFECPPVSYATESGRSSCTACGGGRKTQYSASTSRDNCLTECEAGTYSITKLSPCAPCMTGTYQPSTASDTCISCSPGTWTTGYGTTSGSDCVEYDLFFDASVSNVVLTSASRVTSVTFWLMSHYAPQVSLGFCTDSDCIFTLEVSLGTTELVFGWDNVPLDLTLETGKWAMFGVTWVADTGSVRVFYNGEPVEDLTIDNTVLPDNIVLSVGNTTMLSGLSVSNTTMDIASEMAAMFTDCNLDLPGSIYTLDGFAALRIPGMKYAASTCKASNASVTADHCAMSVCENGGTCEFNTSQPGYRCTCPEQFGGAFCQEELVHGNWSEWRYSGECSASCGEGTRLRYRLCDNPQRSEFGNDCEGNSTELEDCFLQNCTVCEFSETDSVTLCDLSNDLDLCSATCPPGYVLPRGQQNQTFQCGQTTGYRWSPMHRLPLCAESLQPQSYSVTVTFDLEPQVACSDVAMVTNDFKTELSGVLHCPVESADCNVSMTIDGCSGNRKKRSSHGSSAEVVLRIPLLSNDTFDLVTYYATQVLTDSILEAVTSITILEQTISDIKANPDSLSATSGGVQYKAVSSSVTTASQTNCASGQVPVGGVCAQCQRGTFALNGWCFYCDRGYYQALAGQSSCLVCPDNQQTDVIGARDITECVEWPATPPPDIPPNYTEIIIIVVVCVLVIILIVLIVLLARRFYLSSKDRERFDMEADRMSLYTDFADIAYNIYYKRRQVVGFDEQGYPVIHELNKNGDIRRHGDGAEVDDGRQSRASSKSGKEAFAYPEPDQHELPFEYDPYEAWSDDFVHPYSYPDINEWDFPKMEHVVRYRVPGRSHMQNSYPFAQFGYTDKVKGRSRKNLTLPVNVPIPKKLPQLMYRPDEDLSLEQLLKRQYGIRSPRQPNVEGAIELNPKKLLIPKHEEDTTEPVPPLSLKKKPTKAMPVSAKGGQKPAPTSAGRSSRTNSFSAKKLSRSATAIKAAFILKEKLAQRSPRSPSDISPRSPGVSPRATSAMSPRSIISKGATPRPSTTHGRAVDFDMHKDMDHPKPSRIFVHSDGPYPKKSALKDPSESRPATSLFTGRKSVTIKEDFDETRPSTTATTQRSVAGMFSPFKQNRPTTDAISARETLVAPLSARPRHTIPLPPDVTDAYRPTSSVSTRPITPAEHPKPVIHGGVTIKRVSEYGSLFKPPPNLEFNHPPTEQKMRLVARPAFLNTVEPKRRRETTSITTRTGRRVTLNLDDSDDDDDFTTPPLFITEEPRPVSVTSSARTSIKSGGRWAKKPSPPPKYNDTTDHQVIETSSIYSRRSNRP